MAAGLLAADAHAAEAPKGELGMRSENGAHTLAALDSCYLAPGERRAIINRSNMPASMLVIMPCPGKPAAAR
jgi:quercetin dioxygenase-like cupin family protein